MKGQEEIFKARFDTYFKRCSAFARSFVSDKAESELIASEALTVLWQKRGEDDVDVAAALPFLFGIVRNKAMNYLRGRRREQEALGKAGEMAVRELDLRIGTLEMCDPSMLYKADVQAIINATVESLGDKTAEVFLKSRYEGMSNKEIASRFGISVKTVDYHISRALKALRRSLGDYLPVVCIFLSL